MSPSSSSSVSISSLPEKDLQHPGDLLTLLLNHLRDVSLPQYVLPFLTKSLRRAGDSGMRKNGQTRKV